MIMILKKLPILLTIIFSAISGLAFGQEQASDTSDQQINDFSLTGYGDKGKKAWDMAGKTADIFTDVVKLKDINGNLYNDNETIKLKAQQGDFNKAEGKMHLEKDVVITTSSGATLKTDTLDWDRKKNTVTTKDLVNIERENMIATAIGAKGQPGLSKVDLEKNVQLNILPSKEKGRPSEKIIITCDGPLSIDYDKNIATLFNNVKVDRTDSQIYSDKMDIYFNKESDKKETKPKEPQGQTGGSDMMNSKIDKIIARGNVRIVSGENVSYSDEATYSALDKKITLSGKPKLVFYSTEGLNAPIGN